MLYRKLEDVEADIDLAQKRLVELQDFRDHTIQLIAGDPELYRLKDALPIMNKSIEQAQAWVNFLLASRKEVQNVCGRQLKLEI